MESGIGTVNRETIMFSKSLLVTIVGLAPAHVAFSQSQEARWSAVLQYAHTGYDLTIERGTPWFARVDDTGNAAAIGLGYDFNARLGARLLYERTWGMDAANLCGPAPGNFCPEISFRESARVHNWSAVVLPRLPVAQGWDVYATLGVMRWEISPNGELPSEQDTNFLYGAGLSYRLDDQFDLAVEYQRSDADYSAPRLSVSYRW